MFTKRHAERLRSRAGEPYRPSNGDEGERFMASFCFKCALDRSDDPCQIINATMVYEVDDSRYPQEWQYGDDGQPFCSKFERGT